MGCKHCKKDLVHLPGKRKKEFCNDTCRSNFWQKERRRKNNLAKPVEKQIPEPPKESTPKEESFHEAVAPKLKFAVILEMAKSGVNKSVILDALNGNKSITTNQRDLILRKAGEAQ